MEKQQEMGKIHVVGKALMLSVERRTMTRVRDACWHYSVLLSRMSNTVAASACGY
jgi:hypothetical protein